MSMQHVAGQNIGMGKIQRIVHEQAYKHNHAQQMWPLTRTQGQAEPMSSADGQRRWAAPMGRADGQSG